MSNDKHRDITEMSVVAHERMIEFASFVRQLPANQQPRVFDYLAASGMLTYEEARGLQTYVGYAKLFLDREYYEAVKAAVGERIYKELWPFDKGGYKHGEQ